MLQWETKLLSIRSEMCCKHGCLVKRNCHLEIHGRLVMLYVSTPAWRVMRGQRQCLRAEQRRQVDLSGIWQGPGMMLTRMEAHPLPITSLTSMREPGPSFASL